MVPNFQFIPENCFLREQIQVARINPGNPLDSRVLLRVSGTWPQDYDAMMSEMFQDIAGIAE